jgi:hypothetical protein
LLSENEDAQPVGCVEQKCSRNFKMNTGIEVSLRGISLDARLYVVFFEGCFLKLFANNHSTINFITWRLIEV